MFSHVWYNIDMLYPKAYTPEQVAEMLQLSKNTVYDLIAKGEIVAKKLGKVYRIPPASLSFLFNGLDEDLLKAQNIDEANLKGVQPVLAEVRRKTWAKSKFS
jgi:excisionase family DNA binding protein